MLRTEDASDLSDRPLLPWALMSYQRDQIRTLRWQRTERYELCYSDESTFRNSRKGKSREAKKAS